MSQDSIHVLCGFHRYALMTMTPGDLQNTGFESVGWAGFSTSSSPHPNSTIFSAPILLHLLLSLMFMPSFSFSYTDHARDATSKKDEYIGCPSPSYDSVWPLPSLINKLSLLLTPHTTPCCLKLLPCLPKIHYTR